MKNNNKSCIILVRGDNMNDYEFGNYLYSLRIQNDLTQRYVAHELGVTDKAVSKWETGKSKPSTDKLKLLATLYNVSLDKLLDIKKEKKNSKITKIVLTGGPCAGKTTALSWINNYFTKKGYTVLFVPEVATELISNGVAPWTCGSNYDYQLLQLRSQKFKERIFEDAAKTMNNEKILIVCDRGLLDNKAYMKEVEFKSILNVLNLSETKERDSYDAVFHLVTAAKGKESVYSSDNNKARTETIEQAREIDDKIISAWTGHPHFRIFDNSTDFEQKLERLLKEISSFLGEPEPYEIERKYLIQYPDIKKLESMSNCSKVNITQTYLKCEDGKERRIRARGNDGEYIYYLTEKTQISPMKRVEIERKLTQDEYLKYLMEADTKLHTIKKTRYCLTENSKYYEIDIYPEWDKQAIIEIELNDENEKVEIPDYIKVIKEVTEDENYRNYNMSSKMPDQMI